MATATPRRPTTPTCTRRGERWSRPASPEAGLDAVPPRAFLDDTTTKNVIVCNGRLSGIVDVDVVCYGDPLFPVALTRMSLLARGWETDYVDAWLAALDPAPDQEALLRLDLSTAVFCIDFLAELGQRFNRDDPKPVDPAQVARLLEVLNDLVEGER